MTLLTVASARTNERLTTAAGVCGNTASFLSYLNTSIQELLRCGDWFHTQQRIEVCVDSNCIAWPRFVGRIRAVNICKRSMLTTGMWYSFLPFRPGCCVIPLKGGFGGDYRVENQGTTPIFQQIPCGKEWYVRLYIERQADLGKKVTVYGVNSNGLEIFTKRSDGSYLAGVDLTAAKPFASTSFTVRSITRVSLQSMVGRVRLYAYDATNDLLHNIGTYDPGETEPAYVFQRIIGGGCCTAPTSCNGLRSVEALFKLNDDPLTLETDILQIQSVEALKQMMQAVRKEEAGDYVAFRERKNAAIATLNSLERDWLPDYQIPTQLTAFGSARLSRARIGSQV